MIPEGIFYAWKSAGSLIAYQCWSSKSSNESGKIKNENLFRKDKKFVFYHSKIKYKGDWSKVDLLENYTKIAKNLKTVKDSGKNMDHRQIFIICNSHRLYFN